MDLFIKFTLFLSSFVLANSFSLEHNPPHSFKIETSSFSAQFYGSLDEPILKKSFLISPLQRLIPGIKIQRSEIPRSPEHARVARYLVHNLGEYSTSLFLLLLLLSMGSGQKFLIRVGSANVFAAWVVSSQPPSGLENSREFFTIESKIISLG